MLFTKAKPTHDIIAIQNGYGVNQFQTMGQSFTHTQMSEKLVYSSFVVLTGSGHIIIQSCASVVTVWFWDGRLLHKLICYKAGELHIKSEVYIFSPTSRNVNVGGCFFGSGLFSLFPAPLLVLCFDFFVFWFCVCVCDLLFLYLHFSVVAELIF